ncbi:MAG: alpha/beta hydrolase [Gemmobacter sp.]
MRILHVAVLALVVLAACAPRGRMTLMPEAAGVGDTQVVYVGTSRATDPATGRFGGARFEGDSYGRYELSIPRNRDVGALTWPRRNAVPDPAKHFVTLNEQTFADVGAFRASLASSMRVTPRGQREVIVFVHGFNTNFAEGVYRVAQMAHDLSFPGVTVHYSWPSKGSPLGYVYDRDSALFARDGLEQLLRQVADAGAERIIVFGHSMGAALTMETIRQSTIRGDGKVMTRLAGVILMSPDIDVDLFRSQVRTIGKLREPILIFTSQRDRALLLSSVLAREPNRLGNLNDLERVADLDVVLLEVGAFSRGLGHLTPGTSPALIAILNRVGEIDAALTGDARSRVGLLPGAVLTVQSATRIILSPVATVGEQLAR